jgi:hypothetical protein
VRGARWDGGRRRRDGLVRRPRLGGPDLADLPRSSSWQVCLYGAVEAAHLLNDRDIARRAYALLVPFGHLPVTGSLGVACFGSAQHALGVAALTTGELDQAVAHFRAAVEDNLALGHLPAATLSRCRLAQALTLRGSAPDAAAADDQLAAAATDATSFGMDFPAGAAVTRNRIVCQREGRQWWVESGHRRVLVRHSVGMLHLATLLAHPDREIRSVELAAAARSLAWRFSDTGGCGQAVLDDTAREVYRERLTQLDVEIDEFGSTGDTERAAPSRAERDWLLGELSAATGLGGRVRTFVDEQERARITVGKAIRRVLSQVAQADPVLGGLLRARVSTGVRCCYRP